MQDVWGETPSWAVPRVIPIINDQFIFIGCQCSVCRGPLRFSPSGSGSGIVVEPCELCYPNGGPKEAGAKRDL